MFRCSKLLRSYSSNLFTLQIKPHIFNFIKKNNNNSQMLQTNYHIINIKQPNQNINTSQSSQHKQNQPIPNLQPQLKHQQQVNKQKQPYQNLPQEKPFQLTPTDINNNTITNKNNVQDNTPQIPKYTNLDQLLNLDKQLSDKLNTIMKQLSSLSSYNKKSSFKFFILYGFGIASLSIILTLYFANIDIHQHLFPKKKSQQSLQQKYLKQPLPLPQYYLQNTSIYKQLYKYFIQDNQYLPIQFDKPIIIIQGYPNSGKSTSLRSLIKNLRQKQQKQPNNTSPPSSTPPQLKNQYFYITLSSNKQKLITNKQHFLKAISQLKQLIQFLPQYSNKSKQNISLVIDDINLLNIIHNQQEIQSIINSLAELANKHLINVVGVSNSPVFTITYFKNISNANIVSITNLSKQQRSKIIDSYVTKDPLLKEMKKNIPFLHKKNQYQLIGSMLVILQALKTKLKSDKQQQQNSTSDQKQLKNKKIAQINKFIEQQQEKRYQICYNQLKIKISQIKSFSQHQGFIKIIKYLSEQNKTQYFTFNLTQLQKKKYQIQNNSQIDYLFIKFNQMLGKIYVPSSILNKFIKLFQQSGITCFGQPSSDFMRIAINNYLSEKLQNK